MYRKRELRIFERLENLRQTMYRSFYNCKKSKKFSPISSSKFLSRRRIFVSTFFILAVLYKIRITSMCMCVSKFCHSFMHRNITLSPKIAMVYTLEYFTTLDSTR